VGIKKHDFVEINYTGKLKDDKVVFDTTNDQVAKDNNIHNPKYKYGPIIVCIGEKQLVKGLDDMIIGKEPGKFTVEISAENGFGKKSPELLKLIPAKLFKKDDVKPFVGLEVNVDGSLGIVRSVSGGRVIVDFNHPLSSRDLVYDVDIKRIVTDPVEKTKAMLELMKIPFDSINIIDDKAEIIIKFALPEEAVKPIQEKLSEMIGLKELVFKTEKNTKKEPRSEASNSKEEAVADKEKKKKP